MIYTVLITRSAEKQLKRLPAQIQRRVAAVILSLSIEPRPYGSKKLTGTLASYRLRVGDYRVIYEVQNAEVTVSVLKIGHRGDIYR